jgi:hypothetical protein
MNSFIWLVGAIQFIVGISIVVLSFVPAVNGILNDQFQILLYFGVPIELIETGIVFIGIFVTVTSFPTIIFAEIHQYSLQNNKMVKQMYNKFKN